MNRFVSKASLVCGPQRISCLAFSLWGLHRYSDLVHHSGTAEGGIPKVIAHTPSCNGGYAYEFFQKLDPLQAAMGRL